MKKVPINSLFVPKTLSNPHSVVATWIAHDKRHAETYGHIRWEDAEERKAIAELNKRKYIIMSALLKACEKRGWNVSGTDDYRKISWVSCAVDKVGFAVEEWIKQTRRLLKKEERPSYNPNQKWGLDKEKTGLLLIRFFCSQSENTLLTIRESKEKPLESILGDVIAQLAYELSEEKRRRLYWEKQSRIYAEEKEVRLKIEAEKKLNQKRRGLLEQAAANWHKSSGIRAYIAAVEEAYKDDKLDISSEEYAAWLKWAIDHANSLDPIAAKKAGKELIYVEE